jgi:hypothetical protein
LDISCAHTDGHFMSIKGCKNIKHNIRKTLANTVHCKVWTVYPRDNVAVWEPWLVATAQHLDKLLYCMHITSLRKIKNINLKYYFYWMNYCTIELKNYKTKHSNSKTVCIKIKMSNPNNQAILVLCIYSRVILIKHTCTRLLSQHWL